MSDPIIKVEGVGKKYMISHEAGERTTTLRDAISNKAKNAISPKQKQPASREEFWALQGISLEIKKGETLGIIGRNGAGKSTLLKILSRITEPTTGRIEINGRVASLLEIGTGFHHELTGRENVFLNGTLLGMTRGEIKKKFDEIIEFAGVEKFLDTPVKRYSSGMYVRLAFAVAAHLEPEILIVDEVLAAGDAEFQKKCLGKMDEVSRKQGRTVLFVSHNMGAVNAICNRGILLEKGKIKFEGAVTECIHQYLSEQTKGKHRIKYEATNPPAQPAYIKEVTLAGTHQFGEELFDVHTSVTVSIKVIVTEPIAGTTPYYDLKCNGEVIYRSFASDDNQNLLEGIAPGEYVFSSLLHSPLKKGHYTLDVRLIKITDLFYDEINDAVSFETDELNNDLLFKSYWHKRPGLVAFNRRWEIKQVQ